MKANINETPLRQQKLPQRYTRPNGTQWDGYDKLSETIHHEDGWRTINIPTYNATTHRLGALIIDGDNVTYEVVAIPPLTPEETAQEKIRVRNQLLAIGVDVDFGGNIYNFKEATLNNFITATQLTEKVGGQTVSWKTKPGNWVDVTLADAYQISALGMQQIQQIYIDN